MPFLDPMAFIQERLFFGTVNEKGESILPGCRFNL
jgi:hypothetical protein